MKNNSKILLTVIIVAVIAVAAILIFRDAEDGSTGQTSSTQSGEAQDQTGDTAKTAATIKYTADGFSPASVTVKDGEVVEIVNQSSSMVMPSSDPHPSHTDNPELNAGDIDPGSSKKITVTSTGNWGYHNHYNSGQKGTIVVE